MNLAILSAGQGWHNAELERAFTQRGHTGALLPITKLIATIASPHLLISSSPPHSRSVTPSSSSSLSLTDYDALLIRIIPRGSLEQVIFRMDALHLLAAQGMRVFNPPVCIERTVDKFYTSGLLAQAGLPTPRTIVCERSDDALVAFAQLGSDVIVKPLFGSMGLGMTRITSDDVAYRVFKALELERAVYYLQETIPHGGRDIRAFVLNGCVLAAIERTSVDGSWRTNVARGGQAQTIALSPDQETLCLHAAQVVQADYAGVDLLISDQGQPYVIEVNGIPGWQGLQQATGLNVADEIVGYLEGTQATQLQSKQHHD